MSQTTRRCATGCSRRSASSASTGSPSAASWSRPGRAHARWFADAVAEAADPLPAPPRASSEWSRGCTPSARTSSPRLRFLGDSGDAAAALRLAVELLWFWLLSGSQTETTAWLDFALAVPGETDPDDRAIAAAIREFEHLRPTPSDATETARRR